MGDFLVYLTATLLILNMLGGFSSFEKGYPRKAKNYKEEDGDTDKDFSAD